MAAMYTTHLTVDEESDALYLWCVDSFSMDQIDILDHLMRECRVTDEYHAPLSIN